MSRSIGAHISLDNASSVIGAFDKVELNRELTPILAELTTLGPGNEQHPAVRQLFNWLVDPHRTGEEYSYVVGQLAGDVNAIMEDHFMDYMYDEFDIPYLISTAAEALAVRCPGLEGPWEQAAWTLLIASQEMCQDEDISDRLSYWIDQRDRRRQNLS